MNAFVAVLITIGAITALALVVYVAEKINDVIDWDTVSNYLRTLVFFIVPTILMLVGIATSLGIMIFAEVLTVIGSCILSLSKLKAVDTWTTFLALVPLLPTAIFVIIICIVYNSVPWAVALVIVGSLQLIATVDTFRR